MRLSQFVSPWSAVFATLVVACVDAANDDLLSQKRVPKQIHTKAAVIDSDEDHKSAESHFGGGVGVGGHGKYFQYQHMPHDDHYEFGFRRGNDHHFTEKYEKAAPHAGHFKTKARWGDKHGGYGEHYWDYNHAGHGGDGGDGGHGGHGGHHDEGGHDGGYSNPVPDYRQANNARDDRVKRQHSDSAESASSVSEETLSPLSLVYDVESATVLNRATGQRYYLQPIN